MNVFVVIIDEVYDLETFTHDPKVFHNLVDAKKYVKECADDFVREHKDDDIDDSSWEFEDDDNYRFEAYIDGRACEYHYNVTLSEVTVE